MKTKIQTNIGFGRVSTTLAFLQRCKSNRYDIICMGGCRNCPACSWVPAFTIGGYNIYLWKRKNKKMDDASLLDISSFAFVNHNIEFEKPGWYIKAEEEGKPLKSHVISTDSLSSLIPKYNRTTNRYDDVWNEKPLIRGVYYFDEYAKFEDYLTKEFFLIGLQGVANI